jgi:hypothetical protein
MAAVLDKIIGAPLAGTYANSILYTLEGLAVIHYYSSTKRNQDSRWLQAMVYFTFFIDTICTIFTYISVYLYNVTHWGDVLYLSKLHTPIIIILGTSGITEMIVQSFMIYRFWKMSRNNRLTTCVLTLLMLATLGGCVADLIAIHDIIHHPLSQRAWDQLVLFSVIWFSTILTTDISIALALLWQLSQMKSPFKSTQSLIQQLVAYTISTGTLTSVTVTVTSIMFFIDNQSNACNTLGFCQGRIYALTMLYNLNNRSSLKNWSTTADTASNGDSTVPTKIGIDVQTKVHYESPKNNGLDLWDRTNVDSHSYPAREKRSLV